ncbi:MAG TPA: DUF4231 domain-containing protein [Streptosporangiaceae bacterium]|nr:DUF4231 domain-containing protein [Streptosporangiaceae bacterium]
MSVPAETVADAVWRQQSLWSQTANRLKRDMTRWRLIALSLTIAGAVLATLGTQVASISTPAGKGLVWASAIAVGAVPLLRPRFGPKSVEAWARARSASETLKEQVYTYLAGVSPYREDPEQQLRQRTADTLLAVDDLQSHTIGIEPVPRSLPAVGDVDGYITARVNQQINGYYRRQAKALRTRLGWLRGAEFALAGAAVVLTATSGVLGVRGAAQWIPVVTTVSAALVAHVAAAQYEFLLVEYGRTAAQLQRICDGRQPVTDPVQAAAADDRFVAECERIISAQNEAWMAKLTKDPG